MSGAAMEPVLEVRGLTFAYDPDVDGESRPVLDGVDLTVEEGELVLVSGPTGTGKSTLLGAVAGLVPRFTGGELRGDVRLGGTSIVHLPPRDRAHAIGYVGQDPAAGFVTDTVEEELAYGMEQLGLAPETMRRRVEETLDLLGVADLRDRELGTLSGGQQQRVAIGSVLTTHPRLLVLDEPTSALDPTAAEEVLATLTRLVHDVGTSVLLAEHRLERVVPFADRMCLLTGDGRAQVGEAAALLATSPVVPPLVELGRAAGWTPLPLTVREARRRARTLELAEPLTRATDRRAVAVGDERRRVEAPGRDGGLDTPSPGGSGGSTTFSPAVVARGVSVTMGATVALRDVDLDLAAGRVTALMGRNGSGKSTLLWTLQGSRARRSGTVAVGPGSGDGRGATTSTTGRVDPGRLAAAERRGVVGLLPQTAADLLYLETVAEECRAGGPGTEDLLDRLVPGIPRDQHPRDLSEGQRLALALALVLAARPRVVLLDEPTRGLDYAAKLALAGVLAELAAEGHAVLVATHDVEFVAVAADEVVVLAEGAVVSAGPVRRVVAESPAFAPQVTKVLGSPWLRVDEVEAALAVTP